MQALANSAGFWVLVILVLCAVYLLPTIIIGVVRRVDRLALVFLVNLIGGTPGVVWLAALILAFGPRRLCTVPSAASWRPPNVPPVPRPPQRPAEARGLIAMRADAGQTRSLRLRRGQRPGHSAPGSGLALSGGVYESRLRPLNWLPGGRAQRPPGQVGRTVCRSMADGMPGTRRSSFKTLSAGAATVRAGSERGPAGQPPRARGRRAWSTGAEYAS